MFTDEDLARRAAETQEFACFPCQFATAAHLLDFLETMAREGFADVLFDHGKTMLSMPTACAIEMARNELGE